MGAGEQAKMLAEHQEIVKQHAQLMKRAVDKNDLKEVLQHAAAMLGELRVGMLSPKLYYELYMDVFNHLTFLEVYFTQLSRGGMPLAELYDAVQHAGNIVPRLYLLITAGALYIKSGQAPSKDVLADMLEMVKGVQHPLRGLFLRYYLSQKTKDKLPDAGSGFEGTGGTVRDAVAFLCGNLVEMNRLWVRLGAVAAGSKKAKKRERERAELSSLLGFNLSRLSQLGGLDYELYRDDIFPKLIAEIVDCKDKAAQGYLLDGLLQVFPVEFHLRSLHKLVGVLPHLVPDHVTAKNILTALLRRVRDGIAAAAEPTATDGGNSDSSPAPGASAAGAAPVDPRLPLPPRTHCLPGVPTDADVFGSLLSHIKTAAADANGPFRAVRSGAGGGDDEDGEEGAGAGAGAAAAAASAGSGGIAALRGAFDFVASSETAASLLEVYNALLHFALAVYPGYVPYIDATLGASAGSLRSLLGLTSIPDPEAGPHKLLAPPTSAQAAAEASVSARMPEARRALSRLLGEPIGDADAAADGSGRGSGGARSAAAAAVEASSSSVAAVAPNPAASSIRVLDDACSLLVVDLLSTAQEALGLRVLSLEHYASLMTALQYRFKKEVANKLLSAVLSAGVRIADVDTARRLLHSLSPLLRDDEATGHGYTGLTTSTAAAEALTYEQLNVARLIDLLGSGNSDGSSAGVDFEILSLARDALSWGGPHRMSITFPPLIQASLALCKRVEAAEHGGDGGSGGTLPGVRSRDAFALVHDACSALAVSDHADGSLSLRMFIEAAQQSATAAHAYEFFSQAILLYEELADSSKQSNCLRLLTAALKSSKQLDAEQYEALAGRLTQLAARQLRKADVVHHLLAVSHLYWHTAGLAGGASFHKPKEVLAILQRCLRAADATQPPPLCASCFLEAAEAFWRHYAAAVPTVTAAHITDMLALCGEHVLYLQSLPPSRGGGASASATGSGPSVFELEVRYRSLVAAVTAAQAGGPAPAAAPGGSGAPMSAADKKRYAAIVLPSEATAFAAAAAEVVRPAATAAAPAPVPVPAPAPVSVAAPAAAAAPESVLSPLPDEL